MMAQLLAHLWGDYLLQSDWMAQNKRKDSWPAFVHVFIYTLCFVPVVWARRRGWLMYDVIFTTHFLIDRFGLARYLVYAKNFLAPKEKRYLLLGLGDVYDQTSRYFPWRYCQATGYAKSRPEWLTVWLLIIADNTLHLTCNYLALRYL